MSCTASGRSSASSTSDCITSSYSSGPAAKPGQVKTESSAISRSGRSQNPGGESFELMPGLYAAVDEETVDRIIRTESDHARFVAGLVVWRRGELSAEIERGAWYVLPPGARLVLRKPSQGLWEELVRISQLRAISI